MEVGPGDSVACRPPGGGGAGDSNLSCRPPGVSYNAGQLSLDRGPGRRIPLDLDKLDACPEYLGGLGSVCCVTMFIWVLTMPFFDLVEMPWIKSWQTQFHAPITMPIFKEKMVNAYTDSETAFAKIDVDFNSRASLGEFINATQHFVPPLTVEQGKYAFKGLDMKNDGELDYPEFQKALEYAEFGHREVTTVSMTLTTTPPTTMTTTPQTQPPTTTLGTTVTTHAPTTTLGEFDQIIPLPTNPDHGVNDQDQAGVVGSGEQDHSQTSGEVGDSGTFGVTNASLPAGDVALSHTNGSLGRLDNTSTVGESDKSSTLTATIPVSTTPLPTSTATTTGTSAELNQTTTTEYIIVNTGPISMHEFKKRFGAAQRDSPRDAFAALDPNDDGFSQLDEFVNKTLSFPQPLSTTQAEDVFLHLDINQDTIVQATEFFQAFQADKYLSPLHSTTRPLTMLDYRNRMPHTIKQVAAVLILVDTLSFHDLTLHGKMAVKSAMVNELAKRAGVDPYCVKDLQGRSSSVTLAEGGRIIAGRRLRHSEGSLTIKGRIDTHADIPDSMILTLQDDSMKQRCVEILNGLPDLLDALAQSPLQVHDVAIEARKQNTDAFMWADRDHDGALDLVEFIRATQKFVPPLTEQQATYAFDGLDADRDQLLSATEYESFGVNRFFETPPKATTHAPKEEFTTPEPAAASGIPGLP